MPFECDGIFKSQMKNKHRTLHDALTLMYKFDLTLIFIDLAFYFQIF